MFNSFRGNNACGPVAMARVTGIPSDEWAELVLQSRMDDAAKDGEAYARFHARSNRLSAVSGMTAQELRDTMESVGYRVERESFWTEDAERRRYKHPTLRRFIEEHGEGVWILTMNGHFIVWDADSRLVGDNGYWFEDIKMYDEDGEVMHGDDWIYGVGIVDEKERETEHTDPPPKMRSIVRQAYRIHE